MAVSEITAIARLRSRLNESGITAGTWNDSDLLPWLEESMRDVCRRTQCLTGTKNISTVANTAEYTVASDVLRIFRVEYIPDASRKIPLQPRPYHAMDQVWWNSQDQFAGEPMLYTTWGNPPALTIRLYPKPATAVTNGLKLFVSRMPAALSSYTTPGSATLDMPEAWIEVCFDYAEYLALRRDRQMDVAAEVLGQYERKLGDMVGMVEGETGYMDVANELVFDGPFPLPRWLVDDSSSYW